MSNKIIQFRQFAKKKGPQSINNLPCCKFKGACRWKRQKSKRNSVHCGMFPDTCNQQVWIYEIVKAKK